MSVPRAQNFVLHPWFQAPSLLLLLPLSFIFLFSSVVGTVLCNALGGAVQLNLRTVRGYRQDEGSGTFESVKLIFKTII